MAMSVDQSGRHGAAMEIDDLGVLCSGLPHSGIRAYCHDLSVSDCDRLRHRIAGVNSDDLSVYQKIVAGGWVRGLGPGTDGRERQAAEERERYPDHRLRLY